MGRVYDPVTAQWVTTTPPVKESSPMSNVLIGVTNPSTARKGWVAIGGGVITTTITILQQVQPFVPAEWLPLIVGVLALLTSVAVYFVPNKASG